MQNYLACKEISKIHKYGTKMFIMIHCYVKVTSPCNFTSQRIQELLGANFKIKQGKFDEFISPDEGLFERNM